MVRTLNDPELGTKSHDLFQGVRKIYANASGNTQQEWHCDDHINHYDFKQFSESKRLKNIAKRTNVRWREDEGCWSVTGVADKVLKDDKVKEWKDGKGQVRLEGWSEDNKKWLDMEITVYAKLVGTLRGDYDGRGPNPPNPPYAFQLYGRGGSHESSAKARCEAACYKIGLARRDTNDRKEGDVEVRKEPVHDCYLNSQGTTKATDKPVKGRWIGLKQVIYNYKDNGNTYVANEIWIDDKSDVESGGIHKLEVSNKWEHIVTVVDKGNWGGGCDKEVEINDKKISLDDVLKETCKRKTKDIITGPGGPDDSGNAASLRTDDVKLLFKHFSIREIKAPKEPKKDNSTIEAKAG
jgi:hypothetical protein